MDIDELEVQFHTSATTLNILPEVQIRILSCLAPLKGGGDAVREHYMHSLRVGELAKLIADFVHLEPKIAFIAGTLHDVGKCTIPFDILGKTANWTAADALVMQEHVIAGYEILKGQFDLSADIILWHHRFQADGYPEKIPPLLHRYTNIDSSEIVKYGRLLALADVYDAVHRRNDRHGGLVNTETKQALMLAYHSEQQALVLELYDAGIFKH